MPATVAVAHTNERHRTLERVTTLVRAAVDLLGGMGRFVRPGQSVLVKPNQTVFYGAEEGCTTDPLVVAAVVRLAREAGAARVVVGESSGGFFSSMLCMRITGVKAAAEREGAEVIDLGSRDTPNRTVTVPRGEVLKEVPLPVPLLDADVVIDVPKAKNHHIEPISGALKNWVGVVSQQWRQGHHGDEEHIPRFMDVMTVVKPALCVVDAIICGEGDGPIANLPRWGGCVLASDDPVATDVAIARLMGRDWRLLRFAEEAEKRGLGVREPIAFLGAPFEQVSFRAWPGHDGYDYLPINFLVGKGVTLAGTIGHVKSAVDSMLRRRELSEVIWLKGTPTIMIGDVEDPRFEEHLAEGPYLVFDDAARPEYRNDPRVHFVPGHPVLRNAMPELMKGLGVELFGKSVMKEQQLRLGAMHLLRYGTSWRKVRPFLKPAAAAAVGGLALLGAARLLGWDR